MKDFKVYQTSGMLNFLVSEASDVRKKEQTLSGVIVSFTADDQTAMKIVFNIDLETGVTGGNLYQAPTKNRFTTDGATTGRYLRSDNTTNNASAWNYSDYIPVSPNKQYTFNPNSEAGSSAYSLFYDSTKTKISAIASGKQTFTTPSNCYYMRFSYRAVSTNIQLEINDTDSEYETYSAPTIYNVSWLSEAGSITDGTITIDYDGSVTLETGGQTYQLTSVSPIETLIGDNNIWADTGAVSVTYQI